MSPDPQPRPEAIRRAGGVFSWTAVILCSYLGLIVALGSPYLFRHELRAGDIAEKDLIATRQAVVVDKRKTRETRERAKRSVVPILKHDPAQDKIMLSSLKSKLTQVKKLKASVGLPLPADLHLSARQQAYLIYSADAPVVNPTANQVRHYHRRKSSNTDLAGLINRCRQSFRECQRVDSELDQGELYLAASIKDGDFSRTETIMTSAITNLLSCTALLPDASRKEWKELARQFLPDSFSEDLKQSGAAVIAATLKPNIVIDPEKTQLKASEVADRLQPVLMKVHPGQLLVHRGGLITGDDLETLNALGITRASRWPMVWGLALSLACAFLFMAVFIYTFEPNHPQSLPSIGLLSTVSVVVCAIAASVGREFPQFVPVPAAALVSTIFLGPRIAAAATVLLLTFIAIGDLVSVSNLVALGIASAVAIASYITERKRLMFRGFLISLSQSLSYLVLVVVTQSETSVATLGRDLVLNLLGGLSSAIVAIGSLPFLESLFGLITPFRLAELTDASQPLLRMLEENAPGTYQHSLAVSNLAEAGARAIEADVNLVRAGSMYHDIGKMANPKYFIENQLGDTNPHDSLSPEDSRHRVLGHVTDGLSLAAKYGLPKPVKDFIPQHQGTSIMAYFYHKACLRDGIENVDAAFYRYPGPKPQTREAAIVMLSDVSEAVTHSLKQPSEEEVETSISGVFEDRWRDGQFDDSGLTRQELEMVKKAFVRVWRTLHHERLKYPSTTTGRMAIPPRPPDSRMA